MTDMQNTVRKWRERVGLYNGSAPVMLRHTTIVAYGPAWRCFYEEVSELGSTSTIPDLAKEMADVLVTLFGLACVYGIDLGPVFDAVMESNNTKTGEKDANGKVVKGPNYQPPDIEAVLRAQGWEG